MRRHALLVSTLVLIAASLAGPSVARANIIGAGIQGFNPTTDQLDYVTVQSTKTLRPGYLAVGVFANYASNTLPDVDTPSRTSARFSDTLAVAEANFGLGISDRWDAGLSVPTILSQTVDSPDVFGDFAKKGRTEIRANTKYRLLGSDRGGLAAIGTINLLQTQDDPFSGSSPGPIVNLEFALDHTFANVFAVAVNLGHRWRSAGDKFAGSPIDPLKNQFIASVAASYYFQSTDTKLIGEIFTAFPSQSSTSNLSRADSAAEALLGLRHEFSDAVGAQVGFSTSLSDGIASPDFRVYGGLNISFGPLWGERKDLITIPTNHESMRMGTAEAAITSESVNEAYRDQRTREEFATPAATYDESYAIGYDHLFTDGTAQMTDAAVTELQPLVDKLRTPFKSLLIEAHADSMGASTEIADLSQLRANAIRDFLVRKGVPLEKLKSVGYGSSRPIQINSSYQGRKLNRRITFDIDR